MWRIFRKRGEHSTSDTVRRSVGEDLFYRTMENLHAEILPPDPADARERVLEILYAADLEAFGQPIDPIIGRFGRLWYDFIARHDVLPPDSQLPQESLLVARELVTAFAQGSSRTRSSARKVLQLVDQSFQSGNLALCEVLLALFDTEKETRRHNERNVFFDRYTRRMFHQRRKLLSPAEISEFRHLAHDGHGARDEEWVRSTLSWMATHAGIVFATKQSDPEMVLRFDALSNPQRQALRSVLRIGMPYERFRPLGPDVALTEVARRMVIRLVQHGPRDNMKHALEAAYFVALSAGKNESDELLFEMDPWLAQTIGVDTPTILARVHRASRAEESLLRDALDLALNEEASRWVFASRFTTTQVGAIIESLPRRLRDLDIQSVPEGLYDLEQFVGDLAIEVPQRRLSRRLRLCRFI